MLSFCQRLEVTGSLGHDAHLAEKKMKRKRRPKKQGNRNTKIT
jgi:hypothetical protein